MTPDNGILIRNGYVMTMDDAYGDIPNGDVYIRNNRIAAVGSALNIENAEVIDARGMIVLPGLVETHWHLWTSILRCMSGDDIEHGYFPTSRELGSLFSPSDMYHSATLAAAEAIHSGITFIHDWCHNARSVEHVEASLNALANTNIRARFSYGTATGKRSSDPINLSHLARLADNWGSYENEGRLSLGLAWRGLENNQVTNLSRDEFDFAQNLGLPISVHANNGRKAAGNIAVLSKEGFLIPKLQIIHGIWSTTEEIAALARENVAVSISPFSELRIGFGIPPISQFLDAGIRMGLSVDTTALSGNADLFAIMKVVQNLANGIATDEFHLTARRVLALATIEGARSMGLEDQFGSLTPHKCADIIMVKTHGLNLGPVADPAHILVEAAQPANVDTVMIDGHLVKRAGKLVGIDIDDTLECAVAANERIRTEAHWW